MAASGLWRDNWEGALRSPYLLLLFVASVLLSVASFYTTYVGITPFVALPVFAFFITLAIQSLLFVVSWRLGFMYAGKEGVAGVDLLVFAVCFTLSVFFSFNSLFNVIFAADRQLETSLTRVRDGAVAAVNQVEEKLKAQASAEAAAVRGSADYGRWRTQVLAVAELAQGAGPAVQGLLDAQRQAQRETYERLAREARELAARKGTIEEELAGMAARLAQLRERRPPEAAELAALEAQARTLETTVAERLAARDAEEGGVGDTGRAGRGPVWLQRDQDYRRAQAEQLALTQQLDIRRNRLATLDRDIANLAEQLRRDERLFTDIDTEIAASAQRAEEARSRMLALGEQGGMEVSVTQLREYPARFEETGDPAHLAQAETLCNQLYDNMRGVGELAGSLAQLSCDRGALTPLVTALSDSRASLAALARDCTGPAAPSFYELDFAATLAAARACIDLSGLAFKQVRAQREELDRLQREEGPNASEFTKTTNALFAGEKLAWFALIIALAMDLLVLFTGLIGARSATSTFATRVLEPTRGDEPAVIAIKTLLRHLAPFSEKRDGVLYQGQIDLDEIPGERERGLVAQLLKRNTASGMARQSDTLPSVFLLRYGALEQLEAQLDKRARQGGQPAATGPAPGGVPPPRAGAGGPAGVGLGARLRGGGAGAGPATIPMARPSALGLAPPPAGPAPAAASPRPAAPEPGFADPPATDAGDEDDIYDLLMDTRPGQTPRR